MTEERKHAILFAATLLSARKLIDSMESSKPDMAKQFFIDRTIQEAEVCAGAIQPKICLGTHRLKAQYRHLGRTHPLPRL